MWGDRAGTVLSAQTRSPSHNMNSKIKWNTGTKFVCNTIVQLHTSFNIRGTAVIGATDFQKIAPTYLEICIRFETSVPKEKA